MINVRKSEDRGLSEIGWLKSYHTFSFDSYYDPKYMHFRSLRVINEDYIKPGQGFPTHPHRDMEIITYIIEGKLEHKDSMGNGSIISPGEIQLMRAGSGITHSEFNPSDEEPVHLLQIWILPEDKGLSPTYEQKNFSAKMKKDQLALIASGDGRMDSVRINRDADLYSCKLTEEKSIDVSIAEGRGLWIQLIKGELWVAGERLLSGDACSVTEQRKINVKAKDYSEFIMFDLA